MDDLPLQIGQVHHIEIADRQLADPTRRQIKRCRRTQAAGTDDERMAVDQLVLAFVTDLREKNVPAVTQELIVVHKS